MVRFFGRWDWRSESPRRVAPLAATACRQPESWMRRAIDPDWEWTLTNLLVAATVEAFSGIRVPRPGAEPDSPEEGGGAGRTADEVDAALARRRR